MTQTILVVDDERSIRALLAQFLREAGYEVLQADGVAQARKTLERKFVDLVITDINMPGESGLDLIKHLDRNYPRIGAIVATVLDNPIKAKAVLDAGVFGYIVKPFNRNLVLITVDNAIRRLHLELRAQASKRELESRLKTILDNVHVGLMLVDRDCLIIEVNRVARTWFVDADGGVRISFLEKHLVAGQEQERCEAIIRKVMHAGVIEQFQDRFHTSKGERDLQISVVPAVADDSEQSSVVLMLDDLTERLAMERELHQAQRLEAIGQLAAGIAHEINTPVQYIGDNVRFLSDAFADLHKLLDGYETLTRFFANDKSADDLIQQVARLEREADLEFLREEIPATISQSLDGVSRVASIVKAMKEFSHPGTVEKVEADINKILESTMTVSRNEWKYVAEIKTYFSQDVPPVPCLAGELNQVFLNMIVNGAHSLAEKVAAGVFDKGVIELRTSLGDDHVVITIADNGNGMPEEVRQRIFEPFFTTKGIGKGTGQGLTIARNIIEEKHGGAITCESMEGVGTSFNITLPLTSTST